MAQTFANVCTEQTAKGRHTGLSWEHSDQPHVCDSYKDLEDVSGWGVLGIPAFYHIAGDHLPNRKPCPPASGKPLTSTAEGTGERE